MKRLVTIKDEAIREIYEVVYMYTCGHAYGDETSEVLVWLNADDGGNVLLTFKEMKIEELAYSPQNALHIPLKKIVRINRNGRLVPNKGAIKEIINQWIY